MHLCALCVAENLIINWAALSSSPANFDSSSVTNLITSLLFIDPTNLYLYIPLWPGVLRLTTGRI